DGDRTVWSDANAIVRWHHRHNGRRHAVDRRRRGETGCGRTGKCISRNVHDSVDTCAYLVASCVREGRSEGGGEEVAADCDRATQRRAARAVAYVEALRVEAQRIHGR